MSRLQKIQITAQQVAEAIASVLEMEVTIFDEQMVRIAGTGRHKDTIGETLLGYSIGQQVIHTNEEHVIDDIRNNQACEACAKRVTCMELAQLCCPIQLGREVIGAISLIAFNKEQQEELLQKKSKLLDFIRKMAELLSAKVVEKSAVNRLMSLKNQLETVLNFMVEGIIAIDTAERITNVNHAAEKMLQVKAQDSMGFHINDIFPGTPISDILHSGTEFVDREVKVWRNGRQHHYLINATPILSGNRIEGVVASFRLVQHPQMNLQGKVVKITFDDIVGNGPAIQKVKNEAAKVAGGYSTVLLLGESGTGKEIFAQAIHFASERSSKPFVAINCAAIPESLLESELFGYEEGAFSGAKRGGKPGKFQMADGGTLFLDEIGDMPLPLQAKILRTLQEKVVERVGAVTGYTVDVRVVAATHRNLEDMVKKGIFREDLYYRLNVYPIQLPPLRERKEDIAALVRHFAYKHAAAYRKAVPEFTAEALKQLQAYDWPGNIRELENAVECAVVKMSGAVIEQEHLPHKVNEASQGQTADNAACEEKMAIQNALQLWGCTVEAKRQVAASLHMSIATLYRKMKKYKL